MICLGVSRFIQDPSHCAIAACTAIANYYNSNIDYEYAKKISYRLFKVKDPDSFEGLTTGEIGLLFNILGFSKVNIVTANMGFLSFEDNKASNEQLAISLMKRKKKVDVQFSEDCSSVAKFLKQNDKNKVTIDYDFCKWIKESIDNGIPLICTFNWTMFFRFCNEPGDWEEHAVVIAGYTKNDVIIIDSHHESYKWKLKKFSNGKYKMSWNNLLTVMGCGDLIIPTELNNELVQN
jgi:hypothetical protein